MARDGRPFDFGSHRDLYRPQVAGAPAAPISLGWRQGTLRVEAGGKVYSCTVTPQGEVTFAEE